MNEFNLTSSFAPKGDQPKAIEKLVDGLRKGMDKQVLLGVTGSGKTFTVSNVIQYLNKPTLIVAHNKTLARQLYQEFKEFFPNNAVEYFVSYYDYYQPESYLPKTDTYIEKDMSINPKIEQMRLSATHSLMTRKDVIIIASVSCIYNLGDPSAYHNLTLELKKGLKSDRKEIIMRLLELQYDRNDKELMPGKFRVRGDTIDIIPGYSNEVIRVQLEGEKIDKVNLLDKQNLELIEEINQYFLFPARHFAANDKTRLKGVELIKKELKQELPKIEDQVISHRLKQRTLSDIEMIENIGHCKGIENYSRHFDGRKQGDPPYTLIDYFPDDFLLVIDESHQMLPQIHGMYKGDKSRKTSLIDYGFRLPSAYDNRPLRFEEFTKYMKNTIFVSATPADYEKHESKQIVEQIIRPTGLVDPDVVTRPIKGQINDLIAEVEAVVKKGFRTLVTTLTKRMAEELTEYLSEKGIKVRYLHSEIDTLERSEIIRQLRLGKFDVLIGINLLREGLDIPEVALVAILDADKEGFLRNDKSLIQTIGRAARNSESKVILYMDELTQSIRRAITETHRRRQIQIEHNKKYNITPQTIIKSVEQEEIYVTDVKHIAKHDIPKIINDLTNQMNKAADGLDFEAAILIRDRIDILKNRMI